ncbi:hypothetical protein FSP39_017082 [Pinctada imbricata]|uniref:ABC transporter domain-containing protein n=1 Tax=Pinctada imbricata TaxID=66713 RepID=A0AA88YKZ0_PINIB|nr:hypothetical protein FSP39_017082 [Pinctada imbricata]
MFIKKVIHTWRNRIVTFVQFCLPILFTIFALLVEGTSPGYTEEPALVLNLSPFGTYTTLARDGAASTTIDDTYKTLFCTGCVTDISSSSSFDTGSLSIMTSTGITTFSSNYIIGADFNASSTFIAFFNGEPYHSPAVALNFLNNALLQSITSSSTKSISVTNYPFDRDLSDNANSRMNGAKHLQKVSGVGSFVFWLSTFAWDYINYVAPSLICIIVFAAYNTDEYSGGSPSRIGLVFWLFVTYGWTCLPFIYIFSFAFKTPAGGMVAMTLLNIVTGLATLIAVFVLSIPSLGTEDIAKALDWVFAALIPHYNLGLGIMNVYVNYNYLKTCEDAGYQTTCASGTSTSPCCDYCTSNCLTFTDNYLDMASPGIGKNLLFMSLQGLVFFIIILLAEYQVFTRIMYSISKPKNRSAVGSIEDLGESSAMGQRDDDVVNEEKRINQTAITTLMGTDKLIVKNISKYYGNFHAVQNVSVGVASQECFGLLGQNGAGKTTTFKMLTGDEMISSGSAYLEHHDVKTAIKQVQKNLGYCPQFDGLIEQMTGREILYMFARLRGVQEAMIKSTVDALVKALMLEKHADRECGTYSGGNKRKLSTAMALIGDPPFIFLDEPTTGMDPGARRQLWNVLSQIRASGRTLVLTSHSMEECDALCTRIVIMVNEKFPNSAVFDNHQGYLHFQIPDSGVSLSQVFGVMETCLERFKFEDYSVHQTTLEQVFLQFTRDQHLADDRKKKGGCCGCL